MIIKTSKQVSRRDTRERVKWTDSGWDGEEITEAKKCLRKWLQPRSAYMQPHYPELCWALISGHPCFFSLPCVLQSFGRSGSGPFISIKTVMDGLFFGVFCFKLLHEQLPDRVSGHRLSEADQLTRLSYGPFHAASHMQMNTCSPFWYVATLLPAMLVTPICAIISRAIRATPHGDLGLEHTQFKLRLLCFWECHFKWARESDK